MDPSLILIQKVIVSHPLGLHLRVAAALVLLVKKYKSHITLKKGDQRINARSILGILGLGARSGIELEIIAEGEDAKQALLDIENFFNKK
ncbi:MAG TPA: HPr family phosphocarrier protein [bacterium]|nr:HPr family phosphocarrier protein [bacterium]